MVHDLQTQTAERRRYVEKHLPNLVIVQNQEIPIIGGVTFSVTHTCTGTFAIRAM